MADVSNEEFDRALQEIIDEEGTATLLSIPGIYEVLSEHYNNEVIARIAAERDE